MSEKEKLLSEGWKYDGWSTKNRFEKRWDGHGGRVSYHTESMRNPTTKEIRIVKVVDRTW